MTKLFAIQASWKVTDTFYVRAKSAEEAKDTLTDDSRQLPEGDYVDDSFEVDAVEEAIDPRVSPDKILGKKDSDDMIADIKGMLGDATSPEHFMQLVKKLIKENNPQEENLAPAEPSQTVAQDLAALGAKTFATIRRCTLGDFGPES